MKMYNQLFAKNYYALWVADIDSSSVGEVKGVKEKDFKVSSALTLFIAIAPVAANAFPSLQSPSMLSRRPNRRCSCHRHR